MPATLRVGSEVSSVCSQRARLMDAAPGKTRRVRERLYGVIMRSLPSGMWEVHWAGGEIEELFPKNLRNEGEPTSETMDLVRFHQRER